MTEIGLPEPVGLFIAMLFAFALPAVLLITVYRHGRRRGQAERTQEPRAHWQ